MNRPRKTLSTVIFSFVGLILALPASAQVLLEEVMVTAQKREESLQDVGIAIVAFTGDQMRAFSVTQSYDLAQMTPGVHISGNIAGRDVNIYNLIPPTPVEPETAAKNVPSQEGVPT